MLVAKGAVRPVGLCRVLRHVTGSQALSAFCAQAYLNNAHI